MEEWEKGDLIGMPELWCAQVSTCSVTRLMLKRTSELDPSSSYWQIFCPLPSCIPGIKRVVKSISLSWVLIRPPPSNCLCRGGDSFQGCLLYIIFYSPLSVILNFINTILYIIKVEQKTDCQN